MRVSLSWQKMLNGCPGCLILIMEMVDVLAQNQFLDALPDKLQLRVRLTRPPSLRKALKAALELDWLVDNTRLFAR